MLTRGAGNKWQAAVHGSYLYSWRFSYLLFIDLNHKTDPWGRHGVHLLLFW